MGKIILNGFEMMTIEAAHLHLKQQFAFPEYYGCNLDALWDELSTLSEQVSVTIENEDAFFEYLGAYADEILSIFMDAELENSNFIYT